MKLNLLMAAAVAVTALSAPVLASPPPGDPIGLWQTPTNGGQVQISRCGEALCGVLVTSNRIRATPDIRDVKNSNRALRDRTLRNLPLLNGFTGGPNEWRGGTVYNPDDGRTYSGSITLRDPNTLRLQGCVVRPLCRNQIWTRIR